MGISDSPLRAQEPPFCDMDARRGFYVAPALALFINSSCSPATISLSVQGSPPKTCLWAEIPHLPPSSVQLLPGGFLFPRAIGWRGNQLFTRVESTMKKTPREPFQTHLGLYKSYLRPLPAPPPIVWPPPPKPPPKPPPWKPLPKQSIGRPPWKPPLWKPPIG